MVGDRGMITGTRIDDLRKLEGMDWVTALKAPAIAALAKEDGPLQMSLFDTQNFAEITHPGYPGERLICCHNPVLEADRARTRAELLADTERDLAKIKASVGAGRLKDPDKIGIRVGKVINKRKVAKHFILDIGPGRLAWRRDEEKIAAEAALDGIYVIRTSVPGGILDAAGAVAAYKNLKHVERDFRITKADDLDLRPIHHYLAGRVRGHVLICMLACYLTWHLRAALAELTFTDQHIPARQRPGRPRPALTPGQGQRRRQAQQRRPARLPLPRPARPHRHPRPADHYLRQPGNRDAHHPHPRPAPRLRTARHHRATDHLVASNSRAIRQLRAITADQRTQPSSRSSKFGLTRARRSSHPPPGGAIRGDVARMGAACRS